jgi:hypothetical protein
MVERRQLTDDGQDGVGLAQVVRRHVGQVLDLAHHVVAEITDESAVQRWQVGEVGRVDGVEDGLEGGQHPVVAGDSATGQFVEIERSPDRDLVALGHKGSQWVATDEGVAAPPFATLDRLEQEAAGVARPDDLQESGHRGDSVGHQLTPHRDYPVGAGQLAEALRPRADRTVHDPADSAASPSPSPKARKKQVRLPV